LGTNPKQVMAMYFLVFGIEFELVAKTLRQSVSLVNILIAFLDLLSLDCPFQ